MYGIPRPLCSACHRGTESSCGELNCSESQESAFGSMLSQKSRRFFYAGFGRRIRARQARAVSAKAAVSASAAASEARSDTSASTSGATA
jgi:hypothetical protein